MKIWFDDQKLEDTKNIRTGEVIAGAVVPFFHLRRPAQSGLPESTAVSFDGPATEEHKKNYADAWKAYQKSKAPKEEVSTEADEVVTEGKAE